MKSSTSIAIMVAALVACPSLDLSIDPRLLSLGDAAVEAGLLTFDGEVYQPSQYGWGLFGE